MTPTPIWRAAFLVFGLVLAGCAPGADLAPLPKPTDTEFRLGAGDQIRIVTFGEEALSGEFRIGDSGAIAVPLLGPVAARGLTTTALAAQVAAALRSKKLINDPHISVEVVSYRPFFVLGEVSKPGQYPYQPDMTVLTAVAVGGGFTYRAVQDYASIVRKIDGVPVEGKVGRSTLVQPGDTITVFERRF